MLPFPIHVLRNVSSPTSPISQLISPLDSPPADLFIQGSEEALSLLRLLPERGLAVVGTRDPQKRSLRLVRDSLLQLTHSDLMVLSGLARGIDSEAHEAALEADLPTIAVLAGGLDLIYPPENENLAYRILENGGLLVSEFPMSTRPKPGYFIKRNRLIAGFSKAVWVVEAGYHSGALNTAKWAREQNRHCYSTPCYPDDPTMAGNQVLLDRDHAEPFWGPHSFGSSWLGLGVPVSRKRAGSPRRATAPNASISDRDALVYQVQALTSEAGGAQIPELLDWAIELGWEPQRFFLALKESIDRDLICESEGILVSSQNKSDNATRTTACANI
ncbi:MAG TPA: DNA-processing protein DprA [Bdellovibrionota bacterium]|nr:DNA-processing protein DprA [Bdellovibrionota bacterium]